MVAAAQALRRSPSSRRAVARRFHCGESAGWRRFTRSLTALAVASVTVALLLQLTAPAWVLALLPMSIALALLHEVVDTPTHTLHWDGRQWWWTQSGTSPGEPLAIEAHVVIDLEQWMLLRLVPLQPPGRWSIWRTLADRSARRIRWLALSRRGCGGAWRSLRLYLLMTRADIAPPQIRA